MHGQKSAIRLGANSVAAAKMAAPIEVVILSIWTTFSETSLRAPTRFRKGVPGAAGHPCRVADIIINPHQVLAFTVRERKTGRLAYHKFAAFAG